MLIVPHTVDFIFSLFIIIIIIIMIIIIIIVLMRYWWMPLVFLAESETVEQLLKMSLTFINDRSANQSAAADLYTTLLCVISRIAVYRAHEWGDV